ncbi:unnamed protein product [Heligmosomoides polygyrus]|uniref:TPR_REGION domain-containing protein n=1 Tax=Heligmosomoides polygyrus TaxID=6339 RepID=A0A3P7YDV2_HELPZ|nr:unnamed protein product [Heligmosomoides polygyrus]
MVLPSSSVGNTGIPAAEQSTDANRRPERNDLSCDDTPSSGLVTPLEELFSDVIVEKDEASPAEEKAPAIEADLDTETLTAIELLERMGELSEMPPCSTENQDQNDVKSAANRKQAVMYSTDMKALEEKMQKIGSRAAMAKWKAKFLICLIVLNDVLCVHYWKISDDKKRIEAVPDSPYTLAYPGSLVDFLRQIESVKKFGKTYVELSNVLKSINAREAQDDPEIEKKIQEESEHCKKYGNVGLDRSNFKTSYSAELCPDFHKYYERYTAFVKEYFDMAPDDEKLLPRCRQWHREGQFIGLSEEANDQQLKTRIPDSDYGEILQGYFPHAKKFVSTASPRYGAIMAQLLSHKLETISAHPYLHMAAAAYWRQIGDLNEALGCYKTAFAYAKQAASIGEESAQISLDAIHIAAATLFNKVDQPEAAIAILEHSFTMDDPSGHTPCAFLKAQATVTEAAYLKLNRLRANGIEMEQVVDFARVVSYFSEAFFKQLLVPLDDPNYVAELLDFHQVLLKKLGAMRCQIDLFMVLAKQKENLDLLVSEKLRYNDIFGDQVSGFFFLTNVYKSIAVI